jgi:thiol:disulfide interchange protein/DsbC/DsbD-like thiol-disulfide interchange protein
MERNRFPAGVALVALAALFAGAPARAAVDADPPLVQARLVAEKAALAPGDANWIALHLRMREGWHVYWKNPGDSGIPPRMIWHETPGVRVSDFAWPAPTRLPVGPLANYGYEGEVYLPMRVTVDGGAGDAIRLAATATWLVCKVDCIPERAEVTLALPVRAGAADGPAVDAIRAALATVPGPAPGWSAALVGQDGDTLTLRAETPEGFDARGFAYDFFPSDGNPVEPAAAQPAVVEERAVTLRLKKAATLDGTVDTLRGVLVARPSGAVGGAPAAIEIAATRASTVPVRTVATMGTTAAIALAFVGGILLNLMPCVFPVLAIKVMGFTQQKVMGFTPRVGEGRSTALVHALVFAAGILVSFLLLAGALLALRASGAEIGWGFQLQSPVVVLALAFLFFGIAMVLLGVVDVGGRLTTAAGGVRLPSGIAGSFFGGALATAVATPCTAPFMGTALGWALVAPPAAALAVFAALALGMGLPYVALAASPALLRALPRPGPWMETLRQALAFPMFATVVWLLWVFGRQTDPDAQVVALAGLLLAAFGAWLAGRFATPAAPAARRRLATAAALVAVAAGFALALPSGGARSAVATPSAPADGVAWEPYSAARLAALRAERRPVFVDFTAAWCITCQLNERVVFGSEAVRAAFREHGVVPMRADWTTQDPEITRALASFGRSGVPLAVLYGTDPTAAPLVQPTILTPAIVLSALREGMGS